MNTTALGWMALGAALAGSGVVGALGAESVRPLRALYITGGCCHDYTAQKKIITEGISARANIEWVIIHAGGTGTRFKDIENSPYQNPDWARGFDVVVHNECFADDADPGYVERVLAPHRAGTPAVVLHCTMHTFRALKTDQFRQFLGVTSPGHGPQHPLDVTVLRPDHPIMQGFPNHWKTAPEELYAVIKVWSNAVPLAAATDKVKDASGQWVDTPRQHTLVWINTYGQGRVFGTTLAHANQTLADPVFLDLLTRGLLWACDKLQDNGLPKPGYEAPARR
jgi:type 1 glutamine amidotransferase